MDYTQVLNVIASKRKNLTMAEEELLLYVKEAEQAILNYCRIGTVPAALLYIWANMSVDLIDFTIEKNKSAEEVEVTVDPSNVIEVQVGDTSVKLGSSAKGERAKALNAHKADLDAITMNYTLQLNGFRRIW